MISAGLWPVKPRKNNKHFRNWRPRFGFWKEYLEKLGKPLKIYLDKYSTYKINAKHLVDDPGALTQFERAMKNLDIELIHVDSPQAKGRIERIFGAFNKFLEEVFIPKFNEKFAVLPQKRGNLPRTLTPIERENSDKIFSLQDTRGSCCQNTIMV